MHLVWKRVWGVIMPSLDRIVGSFIFKYLLHLFFDILFLDI